MVSDADDRPLERRSDRSALRRDVIVVTDRNPLVFDANAFTPRLRSFLDALSARATVDVLLLDKDGARGAHESELIESSEGSKSPPGWRTHCTEPIPTNPLLEPSSQGSLRRGVHYLAAARPLSAYPRQVGLLDSLHDTHSYRLAVYHLPQTAHLALARTGPHRRLCILEEALERRHFDFPPSGRLASVKWRIVARGEIGQWRRLYRDLGRAGVPVVAISERERDWYQPDIPADSIHVIPHGVDVEYYAPDRSDAADLDVAVFGNFTEARNALPVLQLLEAASEENWRWAIVGLQSPQRPTFPGAPVVTGYVSDVRPYYRRSKVVAVPTFGGTGVKTTLLQAWSMGRPVVATPDAIIGTPARPGENVLLGSTPQRLIDLCRAVLSSPELQRRLAAESRRTAEQHCDSRMMAMRFATLCLEELAR